jgi:hypothetical protein
MWHLHLMGLTVSPLCRKSGAEDETSAHILCQCEALAFIRQAQLGSFLEPVDVKSQTLGAIWRFSKAAGLPWKTVGTQRASLKIRPRCIVAGGPKPIYQSIKYWCSALFLGSSPAQASVAPIAQDKEESRLCCGKDKSVSLSDTRLKEPVVRLKRLSAEVSLLIVCSILYCVKFHSWNFWYLTS